MKSYTIITFVLIFLFLPGCNLFYGPAKDSTGINKIDPSILEQIDEQISHALINYNYINIAVVRNNEIVLTKSYKHDRLDKTDVYASVSKPVTAMILLQLLKEKKIKSLDDSIGDYHPKYKDALPEEYADSKITFRQLLTHTSGVPHLSGLWKSGKLKLNFRPGTDVEYSTHGFGILGDVMEEITGKSYKQLVKEYIATPIQAKSFTVRHPFFDAPAGQVASTISDMARFATGVMDGTYISNKMLAEEVLKEYTKDRHGTIGLGWYCANPGTTNTSGYHAGSNGRPRAFLVIKPHKKIAIALTGLNLSDKGSHDFASLTIDLMKIIDNTSQSPE